jgi:solute carrier family 25, member 44
MSSVPGSVERSSDNWISWNNLNYSLYTSYVSGATLFSGILTYPFYVITTRKQAGSHITGDVCPTTGKNLTIFQVSSRIQLSGLFRGVIFSNLFYIPSSTLYLAVTEISRQHINPFLHEHFPSASISSLDGMQVLYSGILSNFTSLVLSNPANVVLAKLIVQKHLKNQSVLAITKQIYSTFGLRGFFLGFGSNLTHGICGSVVWWWSYTTSRRLSSLYSQHLGLPSDVFWTDAISGLGAGLLSTCLLHPFDTVASRIMTGSTHHRSMLTVFKTTILKEGMKGLYSGIGPSIGGSAASSCIFALTYELIKRKSVSTENSNG